MRLIESYFIHVKGKPIDIRTFEPWHMPIAHTGIEWGHTTQHHTFRKKE